MRMESIQSFPGESLEDFVQRCRTRAYEIICDISEQKARQAENVRAQTIEQADQQFRVLRVLEYTGPMSAITQTMRNNAVQGEQRFGALTIREAILGGSAESLSRKYDGQNLREAVYSLTRVFRGISMTTNTQEQLRQCFEQIYREIDKLEKL